jgi:transglutaminase-like putative cysteine protease
MATKPIAHPLTPPQTGWLLATGLAAFLPLTTQLPAWLSLATGAAFLWRGALAWRRQPLPTRWVLVFVTLAGTAGVFLEYRTLFGQRAGVALLAIFLALKQLEARTPRDGFAIVLLAYFLTLAQFFENQSIPVALTMAATLVVATAALLALTDPRDAPPAQLKRSGLMLAQSLPFMLILFLLFPRVSGPLWGLPADAHSGLTGLSEDMSPGMINNLVQSDAIAFRVKFDGAVPERRDMYWRGPVLTRLEGRTWRPLDRRVVRELPYREIAGPEFAYAVTLEPHNKPWLFALELPVTLPPDAVRTADYQLHASKPVRERRRYELRSRTEVAPAWENRATLDAALRLPDGLNARTVELGQRWRSENASDAARLQRAIDFLRRQELVYTLRPPLTGENVADEFLFDHRRGFCEHFAASFVVLMRAAGVPARVVTGYQGGERNPVDDTWVIRQSDAHAWAEVWLDRRGWVRIDPTAASSPARIEENLAAAVPVGDPLPFLSGPGLDWLRGLRYRWWAVNNAWNQWVLGYDPRRQRDLLARLGMAAPDWRKMTAALAVLSGTALLGLMALLLWRRPRLDPAQRQWQRLTRRLARHGLARRPWEGPFDYARRIAAAQPATAAEIHRIAALYAGLRYGRLDSESLDELRRRISAFTP